MTKFLLTMLVFTLLGSMAVYKIISTSYDKAYSYEVVPVQDFDDFK